MPQTRKPIRKRNGEKSRGNVNNETGRNGRDGPPDPTKRSHKKKPDRDAGGGAAVAAEAPVDTNEDDAKEKNKRNSHKSLTDLSPTWLAKRFRKWEKENTNLTKKKFQEAMSLGWKGRATGWKGTVKELTERELYTSEVRQRMVPPEAPKLRPVISQEDNEVLWQPQPETGTLYPSFAPPVVPPRAWTWCAGSQLYWCSETLMYLLRTSSTGTIGPSDFLYDTVSQCWLVPGKGSYKWSSLAMRMICSVQTKKKKKEEEQGQDDGELYDDDPSMVEPNYEMLKSQYPELLPADPTGALGRRNETAFPPLVVWETGDGHFCDSYARHWYDVTTKAWIESTAEWPIRFGQKVKKLPVKEEVGVMNETTPSMTPIAQEENEGGGAAAPQAQDTNNNDNQRGKHARDGEGEGPAAGHQPAAGTAQGGRDGRGAGGRGGGRGGRGRRGGRL